MKGYHPKKRLGQNFLKSDDIIANIIQSLEPEENDTIVEIGPGRGSLTLPLAETGAFIYAIEFDKDIIGYLNKLLRKFINVKIINRDFLSFNPSELQLNKFKIIGNLPFNITSPVIEWITSHHDNIILAVLMVQKEMAERIAAVPGTKNWSPISIFTQMAFDVKLCFDISPKYFQPPPKVTSSLISLRPKEGKLIDNFDVFEKIVRASFKQRRKLLVNNLKDDIIKDQKLVDEIIEKTGLPLNCRAEQLTIDDFLKLTSIIVSYNLTL
ncbi:MAG: 16S rRNA (adenine(1518)-N(6)/adenine(1519)-N(6))-dimethyltransferase RsmA [bacterium]